MDLISELLADIGWMDGWVYGWMIFDIFKNNFNLKKYIFKTVLKIMLYSRCKKIMLLLFT